MGDKRVLELETRECLCSIACIWNWHQNRPSSQQQKDYYFLTFIIIIFKVISRYMMRNVSHVLLFSLSRKWRLLTHFFFLTLSYCFHLIYCILHHISTSAPLLAPTITNTDMYVYTWMFVFFFSLHQPVDWPRESFSSIDDMVESHMNTWCSKTITS